MLQKTVLHLSRMITQSLRLKLIFHVSISTHCATFGQMLCQARTSDLNIDFAHQSGLADCNYEMWKVPLQIQPAAGWQVKKNNLFVTLPRVFAGPVIGAPKETHTLTQKQEVNSSFQLTAEVTQRASNLCCPSAIEHGEEGDKGTKCQTGIYLNDCQRQSKQDPYMMSRGFHRSWLPQACIQCKHYRVC